MRNWFLATLAAAGLALSAPNNSNAQQLQLPSSASALSAKYQADVQMCVTQGEANFDLKTQVSRTPWDETHRAWSQTVFFGAGWEEGYPDCVVFVVQGFNKDMKTVGILYSLDATRQPLKRRMAYQQHGFALVSTQEKPGTFQGNDISTEFPKLNAHLVFHLTGDGGAIGTWDDGRPDPDYLVGVNINELVTLRMASE